MELQHDLGTLDAAKDEYLQPRVDVAPVRRSLLRRVCNFLVHTSVVTIIALSTWAAWYVYNREEGRKGMIPTYVELRVINNAGYTISGAQVFEDGEFQGQTDSYGEWRKFAFRRGGDAPRFEVFVENGDLPLQWMKNFAVPLQMDSEVKTIELHETVEFELPIDKPTAGAGQNETSEHVDNPSKQDAPDVQQIISDDPQAATNVQSAAPAWSVKVADLARPDPKDRHARVWSEPFQAIVTELEQADYRDYFSDTEKSVGGLWLLQVRHLQAGTEALLSVSLVRPDGERLGGFLRNYNRNASVSAASIFGGLRWLRKELDGHELPAQGWVKQRLRLMHDLAPSARLYVQGLEAAAEGGGVYSYWSKANGQSYVTVVDDDQIVARVKISNIGRDKMRTLSLPSDTVARR